MPDIRELPKDVGITDPKIAGPMREIADRINRLINSGGTTLPIGTVLMYNGTGIDNVAARTEKLGDDPDDTVDVSQLIGNWYVCNGQSSTPNLIDKFIRSMAASGNTGGEDTHALSVAELARHRHTGPDGDKFLIRDIAAPTDETGGTNTNVRRDLYTEYEGNGDAHENKPAYYSLIFIIRMA